MATQRRAQSTKRQQAKAAARAGASRTANGTGNRQAAAARQAAQGTGATTAGTMAGVAPAVAKAPKPQPRSAEVAPSAATGRAAAKEQRPAAPSAGSAWRDRTEGVRRLVADTRAELRRVNWPDQETTRALTIVVIAISAALGVLLGGIDFVLFQLFEAL